MQRFLRRGVIQVSLHLIQLELGVDAFAFSLSLLLLAERFLCLRARFEELRQTLDELEGVVEQFSPVVERTQYNPAADEKQAPFGVVSTGFKRWRPGSLVTAKTKESLQFSMPRQTPAATPLKVRSFSFGTAR